MDEEEVIGEAAKRYFIFILNSIADKPIVVVL